ncbi:NUDIX hydrolase domain-like protein [Lentinula detonsa]|uniref:Oxidized purine nucleoside triphosphate hydrolase n=1 Tax=Lentinula detonsa TaxID=2804962 RepID=A0A9W8P6P9_9AGAR|nr:NUDIX hydrolase domain-like protein [Lentinula detonsa]
MMSTQSIPGLEKDLREVIVGGTSPTWMAYTDIKFYTNAFIFHEKKILLGYKKRGFGLHKYNGFGGKIEPGETSLEAAARELEEEAGIRSSLKHIGVLFFISEGENSAFHIDIYRGDGFEGTVTESEEMRPEWFSATATNSTDPYAAPAIPYDRLWETDPYWFPLLLSKTPFQGRADFRMDTVEGKLVPCKWWFGVKDGGISDSAY